mmetsp:Transcript_23474/g.33137  ORF Transcript_23474/g.33137 Transcript_23474/m.33137 type:complete len:90 (-) Transcript_23474:140-409(-)
MPTPLTNKAPGISPLVWGTILFAIMGCFCCFMSLFIQKKWRHRFSMDYSGMSLILIGIGTFCMWLLWAMTWLAQWNPLFGPQYEAAKSE